MDSLSGNAPWNLNQCTINKNDVNFFVKLVHVDRYGKAESSKQNSRKHSIHIKKRHEQIQGQKLVKQWKTSSSATPSKIISQIPLWNQRKQVDRTIYRPKQPLTILKSKNQNKLTKSKTGRSESSANQSPNKQKNIKTQEQQDEMSMQKLKKTFKTSLRINKTFSVDFKNNQKRLVTQPSKRLTCYNNTSQIPKSVKRQSIKQILFFRQQNILKKKQFLLKRFKTTLNKAKFSNSTVKKQSQ